MSKIPLEKEVVLSEEAGLALLSASVRCPSPGRNNGKELKWRLGPWLSTGLVTSLTCAFWALCNAVPETWLVGGG